MSFPRRTRLVILYVIPSAPPPTQKNDKRPAWWITSRYHHHHHHHHQQQQQYVWHSILSPKTTTILYYFKYNYMSTKTRRDETLNIVVLLSPLCTQVGWKGQTVSNGQKAATNQATSFDHVVALRVFYWLQILVHREKPKGTRKKSNKFDTTPSVNGLIAPRNSIYLRNKGSIRYSIVTIVLITRPSCPLPGMA